MPDESVVGPTTLASDGDAVLPGVDPPSDEEQLAYLAEWGFKPGDECVLEGAR